MESHKQMKRFARRNGFTLVELVVSFALVAVLLTAFFLSFHGIYRKTNEKPGMKAAEKFYEDILKAAGDIPFDEAIRETGELDVLVGDTLLKLKDYFAEPSGIKWDTESYEKNTLIVRTESLLIIYITADGPSLNKPPRK